MADGHLDLGSNVQSSNLIIECLGLGLKGQRPFGVGLNGHWPPKTGGHLSPNFDAFCGATGPLCALLFVAVITCDARKAEL